MQNAIIEHQQEQQKPCTIRWACIYIVIYTPGFSAPGFSAYGIAYQAYVFVVFCYLLFCHGLLFAV